MQFIETLKNELKLKEMEISKYELKLLALILLSKILYNVCTVYNHTPVDFDTHVKY